MGVFVALYAYLFIVAVISLAVKDRSNRRKLLIAASSFGMWMVLALRSPLCGVDLYNEVPGSVSYYSVFKSAEDSSFSDLIDGKLIIRSGMDAGWIFYSKLISLTTSDFQLFLAITAFIEILLLSKIIHGYSTHIFLSFMVFFSMGLYLASFSTLRQLLALSITANSINNLLEKKYLKFSLWVLLAVSLHLSAIIFFLLLPLSRLKLTNKLCLLLLATMILLLPFLQLIITIITQILFGGLRFTVYTDGGGAYTMFIVYIIIFLLSLTIKNKTPYVNLLRGILFLSAAGQSLGLISTGHLTRVSFYFSVFNMLAIPMLVDRFFDYKLRKVANIVLSVLLFAFFYYTAKDGYLNVVPYSFFWESNI